MMTRLMVTLLATIAGAASPCIAQTFSVAIDQDLSSTTYNITLDAPFATTPNLPQNAPIPMTSYLIGGAAAVPPTTPATRTRPSSNLFGGNFTGNQPVAITSGSIGATVASGATPPRPSGAFTLAINPGAGTSMITGTTLNLLGGATVPFTVNVSVGFQSFHTNSPTSTFLIPGVTVPLNQNAVVTSILATQDSAATGTSASTPTPGVFDFAAPVMLTLTVTATQNGQPVPVPPQTVEVTIAGRIDTRVTPATVTGSVAISSMQVVPGPTALDPLPFAEPIYGGQLLAFIVLADQTVTVSANATIGATATPAANPVDFNGDGTIDADDLSDFITGFFAVPRDPRTDFTGDGTIDADDLSDYITAFFSR